MGTTDDVRVRKIEVYQGKRHTTYRVRWVAAGREHRRPFRTAALADSFRSDLLVAAGKGEAFDDELIRKALTRWGFNTVQREDGNIPSDVRSVLRWVASNTRSERP